MLPYKMNWQKGFLLPVMLIWMQIMILFTLHALTLTSQHAKLVRQQWKKQQFLDGFDQVIKKVELDSWSACLIAPVAFEAIQQASLEWWQAASCVGNFQAIQYYYVVERLGEDDCAHIAGASRESVADYYRISILAMDSEHSFRILSRSTLIKWVSATGKCHQHMHEVKEGRQSLLII